MEKPTINRSENMREVRKLKKHGKPVNIREYLNSAAQAAHQILEGLEPVISASPDGILDRDTRETIKLAMETLKTCRELQLKSKALDYQIRRDEQLNMTGNMVDNPLTSAATEKLTSVETKALVALVKKKKNETES